MKGKLFGVGVGPGDRELVTIKAVNTMHKCDIIAVPDSGSGDRTAFTVAEQYIAGKELLHCKFSMSRSEQQRKEARAVVAEQIEEMLNHGKDVAFITLGDPTIYSTYMYIHQIICEKGFETEIIPGVTSFSAVAATLNTSLCEGEQPLHIIPCSRQGSEELEKMLMLSGNKVIMKPDFDAVIKASEKLGLSEKIQIVECCGMDDQKIYNSLNEFKSCGKSSYFSIAIVRE